MASAAEEADKNEDKRTERWDNCDSNAPVNGIFELYQSRKGKTQDTPIRSRRPPPENIANAAKEISKDQDKAGNKEVDRNPEGGAGYEPEIADGEGVGYNMADIARGTGTDKADNNKVGESANVSSLED
jgi:hypothetical protein